MALCIEGNAMTKQDIISFFDLNAPEWDAHMIRNEEVISTILDNAGVAAGTRVLDVACGTGVLFPDYLARNVREVIGVDISPKMVSIAKSKFKNIPVIKVINADAETVKLKKIFDCVVIYNAFPHFLNADKLIENLSSHLVKGGTLTVAHGMSRAWIDAHHNGRAEHVSSGLMSAEKLAKIFSKHLRVSHVISNDKMYQVAGVK